MAGKRIHTREYLEHRYRLFCQLQKPSEIYDLLNTKPEHFKKLIDKPLYHVFTIGKKSGGKRHIENPKTSLKKLQHKLNNYLQAVYYFLKTPIAYGFIIASTKEKDRRDIFTNARKHLEQPYLLNIDIKDFFHSIEVPDIWKALGRAPFSLQRQTVELLTRLVTYRGRLPMGAPTSPVISNLVLLDLDQSLHEYAEQEQLIITRYADDISISSQEEISEVRYNHIKARIEAYNFQLNEAKTTWYTPKDTKEVTGILLLEDNKLGLSDDYIQEIESEIEQLATVITVQNRQGTINTHWVENFKKHLKGKINFLGQVLGTNSQTRKDLSAKLEKASLPPPEEFGSYTWRSFHYHT